ncbi:unnamed protein product [Periconia digitata]|uniref:Uncharacterized protein n=1 Tax=Periconia digitata TaxID=1303443 RepID=A0A9W4UKS3_9PLEO|nr:unnamed protein product [Periconia digitata]
MLPTLRSSTSDALAIPAAAAAAAAATNTWSPILYTSATPTLLQTKNPDRPNSLVLASLPLRGGQASIYHSPAIYSYFIHRASGPFHLINVSPLHIGIHLDQPNLTASEGRGKNHPSLKRAAIKLRLGLRLIAATMCQLFEKITIKDDGRRIVAQDTVRCSRASRGKLCSNVTKKTTEYYPQTSSIGSRREASSASPVSNGPFTPPTAGGPTGYNTEIHRPSSTRSSRRPSAIKPEIVIEIGGKNGGTKIYPKGSKSYKRSSLGAASTHSNEAVLDSPGSDRIPTGYPEASFAPPNYSGPAENYNYRHAVPQGHRHTSSSSSHTAASQVPSLTSEPDSPSGRRNARYPPALVHNPIPAAPPSPASSRAHHASNSASSSSATHYRTETVVPQFPIDYDEFIPRPPVSSNAGSGHDGAPEITARALYREERRRAEKQRQEESDRRLAEQLDRDNEKEEKQVRFVDDRDKSRSEQRNEAAWAEQEKYRAQSREEARQQKEEKRRKEEKRSRKESEKRATKKPERAKAQPPLSYDKHSGRTRRRSSVSMTPEEKEVLDRLRRMDIAQQEREREAADRRELGEQQMTVQYPPAPASSLLEQQENVGYYNPRASGTSLGRRGSISRRGSVSNNPVSITQPAPPQQNYSTRPPNTHYPSESYITSNNSSRPVSARHSSYHHQNPFAQPPTRTSGTSQDSNPFAAPSTRPVHPSSNDHVFSLTQSVVSPSSDPWDERQARSNLPSSTSGGYPRHNALQRMGEQVINRSGDRDAHRRVQAATHNMGRAINHESAYESSTSSEEEDEEDEEVEHARAARYGHKLGMGQGKRRS